jgi:hypothetical protein
MTETIPQVYFVVGETLVDQVVEFNSVPLYVPVLDSQQIAAIATRLRRESTLRRMPLIDIVDAIAETTRRWQSLSYSFRQVAEEYLPRITGYSRPVIARGLDHLFSELSRDNLWALLEEEFGDPLVLDEWRPRRRAVGKVRAFGPNLTLHIMAGNIPGLGVQSLIFALLVKSPSVVKSATDEPLLTALFAQSLNEVCPELARHAAALWWAGRKAGRWHQEAWQEKLLEAREFERGLADLVVVYGDRSTIRYIQLMLLPSPQCRLVAYGQRYSLALVARECATQETARALALDMAMYDQQGCLSPQFCWVEEGGELNPQEFAQAVAKELEALETELPSGTPTPARAARTQQTRELYEMNEATVYASHQGTRWTVVLAPTPAIGLPEMARGVVVYPTEDILKSDPVISRFHLQAAVQAIGLAAPPERAQAIMEKYAAETDVNRFCPIGKMQVLPLLWHHDGRPNLTDFVRWVDWED